MSTARTRKFQFVVTVSSSPQVSEEHWQDYIKEALLGWASGLSKDDKLHRAMQNDNIYVRVEVSDGRSKGT